MNRHGRRQAAINRENDFYLKYVRHLRSIQLDAPTEPGRVYHMVFSHDSWCAIYSGRQCNCNPSVSRHIEPKRS
jgi:hypothetical protein